MADGTVKILTKLDESGLNKGLQKIKNFGSLSASAISAASSALAGLATACVKVGTEYEAQLSRVQAISGATAEELQGLDDVAKKLGAETVFSATEAAAGMENLASAGFTVSEISASMAGMLDLAAVSGGDVAAAADVAASALNAFGLEASEASHVADVFAKAAADTNAEALDMGEAMKYIAPVAHNMGISLEETAAAIGIMSDAGIKGSQAGTTLRGALTRLTKPTDKMCGVMDKLGLSFYDSKGNMISLEEQVAMLQESFEGLTQEEKNNALSVLYGTEALSGMMALIEAGPEKLDELTTSLINSDGAAKEMAETMMNNLKGSFEDLCGSVETLGIDIYQGLSQPLMSVVKEADGYIAQLQAAFSEGGFDGLVSTLGEVLSQALTSISEYIPELLKMGSSLIESFISGLTSSSETIGTAGFEIINHLVTSILNLSPDILKLGLDLLCTLATGIADSLPELIPTAISVIIQLVDTLTNPDTLGTLLGAAIEIIVALAVGLTQAIPQLVKKGPEIIVSLVGALLNCIDEITACALDLILALAIGMVEFIPQLLLRIPTIIAGIVDTFRNHDWGETGHNIVEGIKEGLLAAKDRVLNAIINICNQSLDAIKSFFGIHSPSTVMKNQVGKNIALGIAEGLAAETSSVVDGMKDLYDEVVDVDPPEPKTPKTAGDGVILPENFFAKGQDAGKSFREGFLTYLKDIEIDIKSTFAAMTPAVATTSAGGETVHRTESYSSTEHTTRVVVEAKGDLLDYIAVKQYESGDKLD